MKITFQPTESLEISNQNRAKADRAVKPEAHRSYGAVYGQAEDSRWFPGKRSEKGKTLTEIQQEAGHIDAGIQQDYKTLLANTMSEEDYAKLEKEGFDFSAMDPETAVTIVDKIKAELVRSGQNIAGYTDDLDMATLSEALGSETLAKAVEQSYGEADIPLTEQNLEEIKKAWDMASVLKEPTEAGYQYMADNGMEPEVWDFYLSQSSGAMQGKSSGQPKFFAEDVQGYYTETAREENTEVMQMEIDKLLMREGMEPAEESRWSAKILLEGGIPITKENLAKMQELQSVEFPVTEEVFAKAAASAVLEGNSPIHANLTKTENIYEKAVRIQEYYGTEVEKLIPTENLTARRQLEEIRLRMTAEVNVKLIKSGFAIDTAPMEELVEALRKAEAEIAAIYFPEDGEAVAKYEQYQHTETVVKELPGLPAQLLGPWSLEDHAGTLEEFYSEGKNLQRAFEKAGAEYETLMTAPRRDLGDSIRKAFSNVDDILQDMGLDVQDVNRRAVRILAYNRMSVTVENIQRVTTADQQVQAVIDKMTPASVLKMIREGANPLEMSLDELGNYFDKQQEGFEEASESYSRFLYGLEQNKQITEEERSAFIGIYRMLHQIDASDGAAIGALVNTGAELQFANLLAAVRSNRFKSMDVKVSENFGETLEVIRKGESITEQIARGFAEQYRNRELEQLRQLANIDADSVEMLIRGGLPRNADNLMAAQMLGDAAHNPFKEWKMRKRNAGEELKHSENMVSHLNDKEEFSAVYEDMNHALLEEVEEAALQEADHSIDVKQLQLLHKQLSVAGSLAKQEEYVFPMYVGEELTKVHLTLDTSGEDKGSVRISLQISEEMQLDAYLYAQDGKLEGYLTGNTDSAVTKLKEIADIFIDSLQKSMGNKWKAESLPIFNRQEHMPIQRRQASVNREVPGGEETYKEVDNRELYRIAKTFLEAVQK